MVNNNRFSFDRDRLFYFCSVVFLVGYAWLLIQFVAHDTLSSFATDSANYMVMARYLSPWHEASAAIMHAWPEQDFPIFFPLLLAIAGVAYDYYLAHTLTAFFLVASLPLIYLYARQLKLSRFNASLIVLLLAISPAAWINSLGILSENLYLFLTLLTLIYYRHLDESRKGQCLIFGLLLGLLVITRTIGISMLAAYICVSVLDIIKNKKLNYGFLLPVITAVSLIVLTRFMHNASVPEQYIEQLLGIVNKGSIDTYGEYNLIQQLTALIDAWFVSWLYYWNSNMILSYLMFIIVGLLAMTGLFIRGMRIKLDALYLIFYLIVIIIWPHPGQVIRFIYPIQFLLLIFAGYSLITLFRQQRLIFRIDANSLVFVFALVTIMPAQFYTWHRHQEGKLLGYQFYKEFYQLFNFEEALENAEIQSIMHRDLINLTAVTKPDDRILYFIPAYVALLSDRIAEKIEFYKDEQGQIQLKIETPVDYVYLSSLHPRKTRRETNGLYIYQYFRGWTRLIDSSHLEKSGEAVSYLLKVE